MWYFELLYANYGKSLIIGTSLAIAFMFVFFFVIKDFLKQRKIKKQLKKEIKEGLTMNFPLSIAEKMEMGHNPLKKYEIFLFLVAFKLNNMPFRKTPNGFSTFFTAKINIPDKKLNKFLSYTIKEVLRLEDNLKNQIDFNDIEKYLRKKEVWNKIEATLDLENNAEYALFYGSNLEIVKHNNLECLQLRKKDTIFEPIELLDTIEPETTSKEIVEEVVQTLEEVETSNDNDENSNEEKDTTIERNRTFYFVNNHLKSYELLIHAKRKNKKVLVSWPKQEDINGITHFETRLLD